MDLFFQIVDYIRLALMMSVEQLALILVPALAFGLATHYLSRRIRRNIDTPIEFYITAPGTAIHETGHALGMLLFGIKIQEFVPFRPTRVEDGVVLGWVRPYPFDTNDFVKRVGMFVSGTGPLWFGSAVIVLLTFILLGSDNVRELGLLAVHEQHFADFKEFCDYVISIFQTGAALLFKLFTIEMLKNPLTYVFIYLVYCIGSHMELSFPDIRYFTLPGLMVIVPAVVIFNFATAWVGDFAMRATYWLTQFNHVIYSLWSFVLLVMLVILFLTLIWESFTKKS